VLVIAAVLPVLPAVGATQGEDCVPTAAQATTLPAPGYRLPDGEFVSQSEVQASPDGRFWRCRGGDGARSFFAPPRP
jgi:hypothetical protein